MINEIAEVEAILEGKRINKNYLHRTIVLLIRYFASIEEDGEELSKNLIAKRIFDWACSHDINIPHTVNIMFLINKHMKDNKLKGRPTTRIYKAEVKYINKLVGYDPRPNKHKSKYKIGMRRFMVAMLLLYKSNGRKYDQTVKFSMVGFCTWTGIDRKKIYERYVIPMEMLGFIERPDFKEGEYMMLRSPATRKSKPLSKATTIKVNMPKELRNLEKTTSRNFYEFKDEDFRREFDEMNEEFFTFVHWMDK